MLVMALTAWALAAPLPAETEESVPLPLVQPGSARELEEVELGEPMAFEAELRFVRLNRLGGYGAIVGPLGAGVGFVGIGLAIVGGFGQNAGAVNTGLSMFVIGGMATIAGPVVQSVGVFGASRVLRDHGVEPARGWGIAGLVSLALAVPSAGVGYPIGVVLLAGQAQANREAFLRAYGRPPGSMLFAQLAPMPLRDGAGLALSGRW